MKKIQKTFEGVKIVSLGGFGQVTGNMFLYETDKDIIVVDCGISFPSEEMLGVDLTIPDISYLLKKEKVKKLKGIVLSHGHDDHIGALRYILPQLPKVPVYGSRWALALAANKLEEFGKKAHFEEVGQGKKIRLGNFSVEFIEVTHSIPETLHLVISSPVGIFYHAADFKLDLHPVMGKPADQELITKVGRRGVLCLASDCLRAEKEGFTPPESKLKEVFEREISSCQGRFLVTTVSSNISRLKQAIEVSIKDNRRVVLVGRSIEKNVELALKLGYLKFSKKIFLSVAEAEARPPSSLTLLVAGSQAQPGSALERIVGGEHKVKIREKDKIVFSTDSIPGNEVAIYRLIDDLYRLGAEVSYADISSDIHVSGHGCSEDLKKLIQLTNPQFLLPIGGNFRHMVAYQKMAMKAGFKRQRILLPDGGQTLQFFKGEKVSFGRQIPTRSVMVDALGVGDVGNVVLRDRQVLSEEGIVVAVITVDSASRSLITEPDILTRGFVYVKASEELLKKAQQEVKKVFSHPKKDLRLAREEVQEKLGKFFFKKTGRRPMILTQIVEV